MDTNCNSLDFVHTCVNEREKILQIVSRNLVKEENDIFIWMVATKVTIYRQKRRQQVGRRNLKKIDYVQFLTFKWESMRVEWWSEYRTSLVLERSKVVW